ncbi:CRE-SIG-7 protein [Caenorhabditis remanei]|uniref:Peptidyl-prolyl cis-trans isomerase n=1 Tax=Caenorhabditis remanei TaxID=31234 RepID=E3LVC2_CAERE|nr:CRE-SIG-7 protein [Caenorhabditis remanei]
MLISEGFSKKDNFQMAVLIETTLGDLIIDLFVKERPRCSLNFLKLCKKKYYNLNQFHSIERNYVAQTGDPSGTGKGGESIYSDMYGDQGRYFEREDLPKMRHTRMGIVSFVNNGDNMLGSQFFITLGENLDYLDDQHTIFGQVTEGLETLEKLNEQLTDTNNKPFRDIRISHTIVLDDPFDDDSRISYPPRSPSPTYDMLVKTDQIALDEKEDEDEGKTAEEIAEELRQREMAEQAQILEMVGDLKDADEVPPENVLFVCKLNPVTTDEDLEIIFSRFGKINNCEIVRDRRSGDSLQYAFIEFDNEKSCEQAFFKMDNVLIDDRRIHVDFSQSVSQNYKYKPKSKNVEEPPRRRPQSPPRRPEIKRSHQKSPSPRRHRRSPSPKRDKRRDDRRDNERRRRSPDNHRDRDRDRRDRDSDRGHRDRDRDNRRENHRDSDRDRRRHSPDRRRDRR